MKQHIWNDVLNKKSCIYHVENNKIKEKYEDVSKLLTGTVCKQEHGFSVFLCVCVTVQNCHPCKTGSLGRQRSTTWLSLLNAKLLSIQTLCNVFNIASFSALCCE